jgi:site-specific DNA recombinase
MIDNPAYKGEFSAHRWYSRQVWSERSKRMVTRKFQRPKEEWIIVPVPAVVDRETWHMAHETLEKNKRMASKNARWPYLLAGLLRCGECGKAYVANTRTVHKHKTYVWPTYRCNGKSAGPRKARKSSTCTQSQISARILDPVVWQAISEMLTSPDLLAQAMDEFNANTAIQDMRSQIDFIEREIQQRINEDDRLYRAYLKGAFDEQEFADRRHELRRARQTLEREKEAISVNILSQEEFEKRKESVLELAQAMRSELLGSELPFETKRAVIKMIVDSIELNVNERTVKINGVLSGNVSIDTGEIDTIPGYAGCRHRRGHWTSGRGAGPHPPGSAAWRILTGVDHWSSE